MSTTLKTCIVIMRIDAVYIYVGWKKNRSKTSTYKSSGCHLSKFVVFIKENQRAVFTAQQESVFISITRLADHAACMKWFKIINF